jgi:hypothetical protein
MFHFFAKIAVLYSLLGIKNFTTKNEMEKQLCKDHINFESGYRIKIWRLKGKIIRPCKTITIIFVIKISENNCN